MMSEENLRKSLCLRVDPVVNARLRGAGRLVQYMVNLCLDVNERLQLLNDEPLRNFISEIILPKVKQVDEDIGQLTTSIANDLRVILSNI